MFGLGVRGVRGTGIISAERIRSPHAFGGFGNSTAWYTELRSDIALLALMNGTSFHNWVDHAVLVAQSLKSNIVHCNRSLGSSYSA